MCGESTSAYEELLQYRVQTQIRNENKDYLESKFHGRIFTDAILFYGLIATVGLDGSQC